MATVFVPRSSNPAEVVALPLHELHGDKARADVEALLERESPSLGHLSKEEAASAALQQAQLWLTLATAFLDQQDEKSFVELLNTAKKRFEAFEQPQAEAVIHNALGAHFTRVAALSADPSEANPSLVLATGHANESSGHDVQSMMTHMVQGMLFSIRGQDPKESLRSFHSAELCDADKQQALPHLGIGCALMLQQKYADALKQFKAALQNNPALPAYCRLGFALCYYFLGDIPQARASFQRVLDLSLAEAGGAESGAKPNVHALLGLATLAFNDWREAAALLETDSRKHSSTTPAAVQQLATQLERLKNSDLVQTALRQLQQAYSLDPDNVQALLLLSAHEFHCGNLKESRDFAQRALDRCAAEPLLATSETRATALYYLARAVHAAGDRAYDAGGSPDADYMQACAYYEQAKTLQPFHPAICLGLAQMLQQRGDTERAIENLEIIVSGVAAAAKAAAAAAGSANGTAAAAAPVVSADMKASAVAAASNFDVLRLLGSLYACSPSAGAVRAREALAASSKSDRSSSRSGIESLVSLPDFDRAYTYLQRCVDAQPNSLELLLEFAHVAMARHVYPQAYRAYRRALKLLKDLYHVPADDVPAALLHNLAVACQQMARLGQKATGAQESDAVFRQQAREYYTLSLQARRKARGDSGGQDERKDNAAGDSSAAMDIDGSGAAPAAASSAPASSSSTPLPADEVTTSYNLALLSEAEGRVDAALSQLGRISAAWPKYADARLVAASIRQREGRFEEAKREIDAVAASGGEAAAAAAAASAGAGALPSSVSGELPPLPAALKCQLGEFFLEQGDREKASDCFNDAVSKQHRGSSGGGDGRRDDYAKLELGNQMLLRVHRKLRGLLQSNPSLNRLLQLQAAGNTVVFPPELETPLKAARDRFRDAAAFYVNVLSKEPRNIYAAQGLACVLAEQGRTAEAKDIFGQVKELTSANHASAAAAAAAAGTKDPALCELELPDVWVNLGHCYVAQGLFVSAIKMYQHVLRSGWKARSGRALTQVQLLTYLARAFYLSDAIVDAKHTLLRAVSLEPASNLLWYNLALVLEDGAIAMFQRAPHLKTYREMEGALQELKQAERIFTRLHTAKVAATDAAAMKRAREEKELFSDLKTRASLHAKHCKDNIDNIAPLHLQHAKARESAQQQLLEQSHAARAKLEAERSAQEAAAAAARDAERLRREEEARAKKKYLEDISASWETVVNEEPSAVKKRNAAAAGGGGGGGGGAGADDDAYPGGSGEVADEMARRRAAGKKRKSRRGDSGSDGEGNDDDAAARARKKLKKKEKKKRSKYQQAEQEEGGDAEADDADAAEEGDAAVGTVDVNAELAARRAKAGHMTALVDDANVAAGAPSAAAPRKSRLKKEAAASDDDEEDAATFTADTSMRDEEQEESAAPPAAGEAQPQANDAAATVAADDGGAEDDDDEESGAARKKSGGSSSSKKRRQIDEDDEEEEEAQAAGEAGAEEAADAAAATAPAAKVEAEAGEAAAVPPAAKTEDTAMTDA